MSREVSLQSWHDVQLGDIALEIRNGISAKPSEATGLPILRISAVRPLSLDLNDRRFLPLESSAEFTQYQLASGDLLFTRYNGSREFVGACACVGGVGERVVYPDKLIRVRVDRRIAEPRFVAAAMSAGVSRAYIESKARTTAGQTGISGADLRSTPLPLPPLAEQRRIVAALEEHLSELDAAVAGLERARANCERYTRAVYDAACEGSLTGEVEATKHDDELPVGWRWSTPDELKADGDYALAIGPFGSNLKVSDYAVGGVPLVFVRNIRAEYFGPERTRYVSPTKAAELRAHQVTGGDLLVTKMGDPPGDVCRYPVHAAPAIITADCIKWSVNEVVAVPDYLVVALRSSRVRRRILEITKGVAQLKVSLERFRELRLPLPTRGEQVQIVAITRERVENVRRVIADIDTQLARATRLRQSILKHAIEGKLVPHDPNDEPASVLVERISAVHKLADQPTPRTKRKAAASPRRSHKR